MFTTIDKKQASKKLTNAATSNFELTNNSGVDLVVLDAFDTELVPANALYQQNLQLLQASNGTSIIAVGNTTSFLLNGAHQDSKNQVQHSDFYTLIVAQANNLFPIKVLDLNPTAASNYTSATITKADVQLAKKAEKFQQQLMAFPSSDLCQKFVAALQKEDETAGDAFLKSTEDYKDVTVNQIAAVTSYYNRFPFVFADYKQIKTYSLYSSDGEKNIYIGSVRLRSKAIVPPSVAVGTASFTAVFEAPDSSTTELYYKNGAFVNDVTVDNPSISLSGSIIVKSLLTQVEAENILISILVGNVNGISVFGIEDHAGELATMSTALDDLLDPKDTKNWLEVAAILLGAVIVLGVLIYSVRRCIRSRKKAGVNPDPKEQEALAQRLQEEARIREQNGEGLVSTWEGVKAKTERLLIEENRTNMRNQLKQQQAYLDSIAKHTNNTDLQDVRDTIKELTKAINDSTTVELKAAMKDIIQTAKNNATTLNDAKAEFIDHVSQPIKDDLKRKEDLIKDLSEKMDNIERSRDDWANDEPYDIAG